MPKQVNPLSVLHPATEITTSARVKIMRTRKQTKKLNDEVVDELVDQALEAVVKLEIYLKNELDREKRLSNASKNQAGQRRQGADQENIWRGGV